MRALVKELSPECLDTAGHTPLMYAVFGRQAKVYFHGDFNCNNYLLPVMHTELPSVASNES